MKTTITLSNFRDAFARVNRTNFSYDGLAILFDHLEQLEQDIGEEFELDVIGLCCDFCEMSVADVAQNYGIDSEDALGYLNDNTLMIGQTDAGTIVFAQF